MKVLGHVVSIVINTYRHGEQHTVVVDKVPNVSDIIEFEDLGGLAPFSGKYEVDDVQESVFGIMQVKISPTEDQ